MSQRMYAVVGPDGEIIQPSIGVDKQQAVFRFMLGQPGQLAPLHQWPDKYEPKGYTVQPVTVAVDCIWRDSVRGEDGEHQAGCAGPVWSWDRDNWTNCPYCGGKITTDTKPADGRGSD